MQVALQPRAHAHTELVRYDYNRRLEGVVRQMALDGHRIHDGLQLGFGCAVMASTAPMLYRLIKQYGFTDGTLYEPLTDGKLLCYIVNGASLRCLTSHRKYYIAEISPRIRRCMIAAFFAFGTFLAMNDEPELGGAVIAYSSFSTLVYWNSPDAFSNFLSEMSGQIRAIPFRVTQTRTYIAVKHRFFLRRMKKMSLCTLNGPIAQHRMHPFLTRADLVRLAATCRVQERLVFSNDARWAQIAQNMGIFQPYANTHAQLVQYDYKQRLERVVREKFVDGLLMLDYLQDGLIMGIGGTAAIKDYQEGSLKRLVGCEYAAVAVMLLDWISNNRLRLYLRSFAMGAIFGFGAVLVRNDDRAMGGALIAYSSVAMLVDYVSLPVAAAFLGKVRAIPFRATHTRTWIAIKHRVFHRVANLVDNFCRGGMFMKL